MNFLFITNAIRRYTEPIVAHLKPFASCLDLTSKGTHGMSPCHSAAEESQGQLRIVGCALPWLRAVGGAGTHRLVGDGDLGGTSPPRHPGYTEVIRL